MSTFQYQILPLTSLKRSARRTILGKIEHTGIRFIVTDYGEAVAELGPLSKSAEEFMTAPNGTEAAGLAEPRESSEANSAARVERSARQPRSKSSLPDFVEGRRRRSSS